MSILIEELRNLILIQSFSTESSGFFVPVVDNEEIKSSYKPISYTDLIEDTSDKLKDALSECNACSCNAFTVEDTKCVEDAINDACRSYECSSDASSVFISINDFNKVNSSTFILADTLAESRKSAIDHRILVDEPDFCIRSHTRSHPIRDDENEITPQVYQGRFKKEIKLRKISKLLTLPSKKSSSEPFFRFLLPTNFELLEGISPLTYLETYCWICDSRSTYYQKELTKHRDSKEGLMILPKLFQLLNAVLMYTLSEHQYAHLCRLLVLTEAMSLTTIQMFDVCAVSERLYFFQNLSQHGEIAFGISKGYQEMIDFKFINQRMTNYNINVYLKGLFGAL